jgi:hypothetical protein
MEKKIFLLPAIAVAMTLVFVACVTQPEETTPVVSDAPPTPPLMHPPTMPPRLPRMKLPRRSRLRK